MSRRIELELTSVRDDGTWTWRAAGARQPKGTLDGSLLPTGAAVGDVLRADVETDIDGTSVTSVLPPKGQREEPERIELLSPRRDDELVTTTLVARRGGGGRDGRDGDRGRDRSRRPDGAERPGRRDGPRPPRSDRPDGPGDRGPSGGDRDRPDRRNRPEGPDQASRPRRERPAPPPRPKAKRLRAGRQHRKAALDALSPEQQVIGEQVLRGGVPAVRQAVDKQNEQARAAGQPEVRPEPLLALAEQLLPALRAAEWHDRAMAALADVDDLDLRDLRSVVVAAEVATRDDETRELAGQLREALTRRVDHEQSAWLEELATTLADGRVVRALRLSSRPPKAGSPLPADLLSRLASNTAAALTADTIADRWATVLDALSFSPVRLAVTPQSVPEQPNDELVGAIRRVAARVPQVAALFGIEADASPKRRGARRPKTSSSPPIPPPPTQETSIADPPVMAQTPAPDAPEAPAEPAPDDGTEPFPPTIADPPVMAQTPVPEAPESDGNTDEPAVAEPEG